MKMRLLIAVVTIVGLLLGPLPVDSLLAQAPPADDSAPLLSQADLEQLVAPIALYPDPLVALILQAATVPTDIVLADRYVQNGGDPNGIDSQSWDDSVKGLARYPDTLKMMDDNLDWTNQLGAAVLAQQADVMNAIQAQRAKAETLGNLQTTAQQQVVTDQGAIQILPADPQVIYVPVYDPQVVYVQQAPAVPFITFGLGLAVGAWLGGDCDWHNHGIYRGGYYRPGYGWGGNNVTIINNNVNVWRPNPNKPRPRPPYQPGRPSRPDGGNGQLPGWRPPPGNGNGGNRPGGPGNGGNRPGGPGNRPGITPLPGGGNGGNRPGGPGTGPGNGNGGNRPGKPGHGAGNRPGGPGNRPENPGKPSILPAPGGSPGQTKPAPDRTRPGTTRPGTTKPAPGHGSFNPDRPNTKRPTHPSAQPAKPQPQRPAPRPQAQPQPSPQPKPAAQRPAARPAPAQSHGSFNRQQPNTKQAGPNRPAPAAKPAGNRAERGR